MSEANLPFFIVLLLGSYDPDTRELMDTVKLKIAEKFGGENTYTVLLENIYVGDVGRQMMLASQLLLLIGKFIGA